MLDCPSSVKGGGGGSHGRGGGGGGGGGAQKRRHVLRVAVAASCFWKKRGENF